MALKPQRTLKKKRGTAKGTYFEGMAVTLSLTIGTPAFSVVAADMETLRKVWARLVDIPLDESGIVNVSLFRESDTTTEQ